MNNNYYEYEYIRDEGGNVSGIVFRHKVNKDYTTPLSDTFEINVNKYYSLYDRLMRKANRRFIKVVRIEEDGKIYFKEVHDFTDNGEFTKSVIDKFDDDIDALANVAKMRLGTGETFISVTNFSGTDTSKPRYSVTELHPPESLSIEGGRNKRGRKSKKYSKTKSKSRTRRGGRRSRRVRQSRKVRKSRRRARS